MTMVGNWVASMVVVMAASTVETKAGLMVVMMAAMKVDCWAENMAEMMVDTKAEMSG